MALGCVGSEVEVTLLRVYQGLSNEEKLKIYQGTTINGALVFQTPTVTVPGSHTYTFCAEPGQYLLYMTDTYGDGWTTGSTATLSTDNGVIGSFRLPNGYTGSEVITISPIVTAEWHYSNEPQTSTSWTTGATSWPVSAEFPAVSTVTRYFRSTFTPEAGNYGIRITVNTDVGFRVFLNGVKVLQWGLPEGEITPTTYATNSTETTTPFIISTTLAISGSTSQAIVGVEVHATQQKMSGAETFSGRVSLISGPKDRLVDAGGSFYSYPQKTGSEGTDKLFDNDLYTKWYFERSDNDPNPWVVWTFGDYQWELMNQYELATANDVPTRDCRSWKIYGSMDETDWVLLDEQVDIEWTARYQRKEFTIENYVAYHAYKWECTRIDPPAVWTLSMQMSEWNLLLTDQPFVTPGLHYPQDEYTWSVVLDTVSVSPSSVGFSNFAIAGPEGVTLPTGLTFSTANGEITGTPLAPLAATVFTISATGSDGQSYTTTLTITVNGCDLPNNIPVIAEKTNPAIASEQWQLKNSEGTTIMSSTSSTRMCIPAGDYNLVLSSSSGTTWADNSYLTLSTTINGNTFTLAKTRLTIKIQDTIKLPLIYPVATAAHTSFKYVADGTVPENWFATSFSDAQWTALDDANRPATPNKIQLFRTTFNVASVTGYHGFEMQLKYRAGVVVYLNGEEIYRRNLPAGAISSTTTAIGGEASSSWKTVSGVISQLIAGQNTLAVGIVTLTENAMDFDAVFRIMGETILITRYWSYTTINSSDNLFDINSATTFSTAFSTAAPAMAGIKFTNRAEAFNEYCLVTSSAVADHDPADWTIEGSNDDETFETLDTRTGVVLSGRETEYCFYMANNKKAFSTYRMKVTALHSATASSLSLSQWNLYIEDLASLVVPDLSFTPSTLTGYTGASFPSSVCSSPYYNSFTISPALPEGLYLDRMSGVIYGSMAREYASTVHTITALNHLGEEKTTTVTVAVQACAGDHVFFTLIFEFGSDAASCSYQLKDRATGSIVDYRDAFINDYTLTIPMCRAATTYSLVLKKTDTSGWGSNNVKVQLADGSILLTESLAAGAAEKEYPFNPAYSVYPQWTAWRYLYGSAPANWNSDASVSAQWETARPESFPAADRITQYYVQTFEIPSLAAFASMDITVTVKAGAIVYLNGQEIRRVSLPAGNVDGNTSAESEYPAATMIVTGVSVLRNLLKEGENVLAIELHRFLVNEDVNSFDASALLILDNMYMLKDGFGTTKPSATGDEGSDKLFDNNSSTKFSVAGCVGTEFMWEYANGRREAITNYGLVSGNDCNMRHPSGWKLSASNDGQTWVILHQTQRQYFSLYNEQKRYDMYNTEAYSMYKVEVTECNNEALDSQPCGEQSFQLADFYLFSKRIDRAYCAPEDDYPGALEGENSYKACPAYYEGMKFRTCTEGKFSEETDLCNVLAPASIVYPQEIYNFVAKKNVGRVVPTIAGAEVRVYSFPELPAGLSIEESTGAIVGTPTTVTEMKKLTITAANKAGSVYTTVSMSVEEAPINWVLIGILIAVGVIVIVAIVVLIVMMNKKKSAKPKMAKSSKASKAAPKPAPVKPKAAVKV